MEKYIDFIMEKVAMKFIKKEKICNKKSNALVTVCENYRSVLSHAF